MPRVLYEVAVKADHLVDKLAVVMAGNLVGRLAPERAESMAFLMAE